ncbi:MAG: SRPBCC family protein [bacterium]|nr:SRPBCC family protein [bacterium]
MKYKNEVIIKAPREKVVELFDNPENMKEWQPGFVSMELIEGELGKVGSKHKLHYKMGKREIDMIETITKRDLPNSFSATYEAKKVFNNIDNHFEDLGDGTTKYWTENEFRLSGSMKLFGWIMPGAFKKQSQKYMNDFRDFVEREV